MTSNVWHCFCSYCTKNTGAYYISALSCHTASCRHIQCWKQDQKYKTKTEASLETGLVIRPWSQIPRLYHIIWIYYGTPIHSSELPYKVNKSYPGVMEG